MPSTVPPGNGPATGPGQPRATPTLSAPRLLTFLASAVPIGLAVASRYAKVPVVHRTVAAHRQWFFIGAYVLLALG